MAEDHLFFRLRIPKELGDAVTDLAWVERRSVNSQICLLLEKALNWPKSKSTVKETAPGRGAKPTAQSRRRPPIEDEPNIPFDDYDFEIGEKDPTKVFKPMTMQEMVELQKMAERIQKIMGGAKQDDPIKRPKKRR